MLWLGDNPADVYYLMTPEDHRSIISKLTNKLLEHYNRTGGVYGVLGNHEGLPRDHMELKPNGTHWLLDMVSDIWKSWFTAECNGLRIIHSV